MSTVTHTQIANPEDYVPNGEYNPHNVRPWMMGNEYGPLAIAYASHEQEAFDYAADADLLKGLAMDEEDAREYEDENAADGIMRLGNDGAPYDCVNAWIKRLPNLKPDELAAMNDQELREVAK